MLVLSNYSDVKVLWESPLSAPSSRSSYKTILKNPPSLGLSVAVLAHELLTDDSVKDNPLSPPSLSVGSDATLGRKSSQQLPTSHPSGTASAPASPVLSPFFILYT